MSVSSILSLSFFEKVATVLGRPKLRLSYDETSQNCRERVTDRLTFARPFVRGVPGTYVMSESSSGTCELAANAIYLRVMVENIGKSKAEEGCRVFVTSVSVGTRSLGIPASQLQWAHVPSLHVGDRFVERTLHVGVPQTVDVCRVNSYERCLALLSEHADRGGDRFEHAGTYDIGIRGVGTNFVSPGWITLRVHFDPENLESLSAEVLTVRGNYRMA